MPCRAPGLTGSPYSSQGESACPKAWLSALATCARQPSPFESPLSPRRPILVLLLTLSSLNLPSQAVAEMGVVTKLQLYNFMNHDSFTSVSRNASLSVNQLHSALIRLPLPKLELISSPRSIF